VGSTLVTADYVSHLLGVSIDRVYFWGRSRAVPGVRRVSGHWLFDLHALCTYLVRDCEWLEPDAVPRLGELVGRSEAAALLETSIKNMSQLAANGKLAFISLPGKRARKLYPVRHLQTYKQQRQGHTPMAPPGHWPPKTVALILRTTEEKVLAAARRHKWPIRYIGRNAYFPIGKLAALFARPSYGRNVTAEDIIAAADGSSRRLSEVAVMLNLDRSTVLLMVHSGSLPAYRQPGGWWLVPRQAIQEYQDQPHPDGRYLSPRQVARLLRIPIAALPRLERSGKLTPLRYATSETVARWDQLPVSKRKYLELYDRQQFERYILPSRYNLRTGAARQRLGINSSRLDYLIRTGQLDARQTITGLWWLCEGDVEEYRQFQKLFPGKRRVAVNVG
jgi:excisionase family DNA binding protein